MSENQIVAQSHNSVITFPSEYPGYLKALFKPHGYSVDAGPLVPGDIGINIIKIVQKVSKETEPGWGQTQHEAPMAPGTMFMNRDHTPVPPDTVIFPLLRTITIRRYEGKPGEGKLLGVADHRNDERILRENGLQFRRGADGVTLPPLWTEYTNIYVACKPSKGEPALISFYRSSHLIGRKWLQLMLRNTIAFSLPLYTHKYKLGTPFIERKGINSWFQFNIVPDGITPEIYLPKLKDLYETAVMMHAASQGSELEMDQTSEPEQTPNTEVALLCKETDASVDCLPDFGGGSLEMSAPAAPAQAAPAAPAQAAPAAPAAPEQPAQRLILPQTAFPTEETTVVDLW